MSLPSTAPHIAVIGPGRDVSADLLAQAHQVGRLLAARGAVLLTGGLGGVMEAASRGAYEAGGRVTGPAEAVTAVLGRQSLRIGTWNLDARHQQAQTDLLVDLDCDVLLLTEVSPHLELGGYSKVLTSGVMARGQHWAGVFSRRHSEQLPEPHPASAAARIDGQVFVCSILPWAGCGTGEPWGSGSHGEKTGRTVNLLRTSLRPDWVWGGDWNHALIGQESAGSMAGRLAVRELLDALGLQVPTADLPHHLPEIATIDHIAVPRTWQVLSAERVSAVHGDRRLSDHDAYVVDVVPQ